MDKLESRKKKPRGGNSPVIGENGYDLAPGDNSKYLGFAMTVGSLGKVDLKNEEQVETRVNDYFRLCFENDMKPAVSGLALALGISRQTLWAINNDQPLNGQGYRPDLPPGVVESIKKGYAFMENLWESYAQNGKLNPIMAIFLGKNHYHYTDKQEYVVTPNTGGINPTDVETIEAKYAELPEIESNDD